MMIEKAEIRGIGYDLPAEKVSTSDLERNLGPLLRKYNLPENYVELLTGVRERRYWPTTIDGLLLGSVSASRRALERAHINASRLGALVYAGVCRHNLEPAMACSVGEQIGLSPSALVYDVSNACLGMLNGMVDLASKISSGQLEYGMVVACESSREIIELTTKRVVDAMDLSLLHRSLATFTGGSGAAAVVIGPESDDASQGHRFKGATWRNEIQHNQLCQWGFKRQPDHSFAQVMETHAPQVLKAGVQLGKDTWQSFLTEVAWTKESIRRVIPHQVGKVNRQQMSAAMGLHSEQDIETYSHLGNMGSVSVPLSAAIAEEQGLVQAGDRVVFAGIGSGLNCIMMGVEW